MRDNHPPLTFVEANEGLSHSSFFDSAGSPSQDILFAEYRPWRKVRYIAPEAGLTAIDAWRLIKRRRFAMWQSLGVPRFEGGHFGFCTTPQLQESLLLIDRSSGVDPTATSGKRTLQKRLIALHADGQLVARRRIDTFMGEAAESSIMEGASTTRSDAIDMLRSGRVPTTLAERMVLNNYMGMQRIKDWLDRPLSLEMLLELQEILTEGTLDDPTASGRLRNDAEPVRVVDTRTEDTIFIPPPVSSLRPLIASICEFANREHSGSSFVHPVVKAAVLHFLVGYAHPFIDGNGRTARAVFYWFALRHGYGLFEFLSISEIIRKGYARYPQAYLDCELDDGDLTYFILYHLDVIQQSLDRLSTHIEMEQERLRRSESILKLAKDLNLRQRLLLEHALRHPLTHYTVKSHANSNGIVLATSRADLDDLVRRRMMVTTKQSKQVIYMISPGMAERLKKAKAK